MVNVIMLQFQDNKCAAFQCTTDYKGSDYTASLTLGNNDILNNSGKLGINNIVNNQVKLEVTIWFNGVAQWRKVGGHKFFSQKVKSKKKKKVTKA